MAKQKAPPKPLYPLRHEFSESLEAALMASGGLYTIATQLLSLEIFKDQPQIREMLRERVSTYRHAFYGDE